MQAEKPWALLPWVADTAQLVSESPGRTSGEYLKNSESSEFCEHPRAVPHASPWHNQGHRVDELLGGTSSR